MLKNFTYRQKNIGLAVLGALVIFIAWSLSFEKTFDLMGECSRLESELEAVGNAPIRISQLKSELAAIDHALGRDAGTTDFQQVLLERISSYCQENNLVLKEFPQPWVSEEQDFLIETNVVVVEGGFVKLLNLLYQLEQKQKLGKIAGVQFNSKKDLRTKRLRLTASIYVQNIKKATNEA